MNEDLMEKLGDRGFRLYNSLREFYDESDRMQILNYIITYATEELKLLNIDDEKAFREHVRIRGYTVVKKLYDLNIKHINKGKGAVSLRFPTPEQVRKSIKKKYSCLEQKIAGGE